MRPFALCSNCAVAIGSGSCGMCMAWHGLEVDFAAEQREQVSLYTSVARRLIESVFGASA